MMMAIALCSRRSRGVGGGGEGHSVDIQLLHQPFHVLRSCMWIESG